MPWHPQGAYYYAVENGGFQASPERTPGTYSKYNSIDDKIDDLHYYTTHIKFGIGRATADTAHEIRDDKITRDEGVRLVKKYDSEISPAYFHATLDYMEITEKEFWSVIDTWRSPHLWVHQNGDWKLRHAVWHEE